MSSWRSRTTGRLATAPAAFIDPCLLTDRSRPPSGADWLHEIKHDGYRLQVHRHGDTVRLYTRRGADWTARYPAIVAGALALKATAAILDCEAVCCDDDGLAIFDRLTSRIHDREAFAYAFDLLMLAGEDMRLTPIETRKAKLRAIVPRSKVCGIQYVEHLEGDGPTIFAHACRLGLEGIVSKRRGSLYRSRRHIAWVRSRNPNAPGYMRVNDANS